MGDTRDLSLILDANIPIVAIESPDERRVLGLLLRLAMQRASEIHEWSSTRGLRRGGFGTDTSNGAELTDPEAVLQHIVKRQDGPAIYALCDMHPYFNEPKIVRQLKDIALDFNSAKNTLILISHKLDTPAELSRYTASFNLRLPSDDELMAIVRKQAQSWGETNAGARVKTDRATLEKLIANLRGVTHADAQVLIRHAIFSDGAITESDIPAINRLKFELLDAEGVLRYEYDTESFSQVAGLHNLKSWLALRREPLLRRSSDRPRGVMLLGVQGGGKSLAAKSVAGAWGLPLLRLDFGALYNKFFGETERNLRNSLAQAELMAPCVLWMDEIEKGLATGDSDNATSQRVLSTLLTWMAENDSPVFIVATSNDLTRLPPELVRKGRLDEIFFVDLPDAQVRRAIFAIHLAKRDANPDDFDLEALAECADGFTGAEIEEAIVSARYLAASQDQHLSTDSVLAAVNRTYPMSVLRAESIRELRAWAKDRTVMA
jgi:SpoVK/Ycf46/Vps4 family AAA+-type ATPase